MEIKLGFKIKEKANDFCRKFAEEIFVLPFTKFVRYIIINITPNMIHIFTEEYSMSFLDISINLNNIYLKFNKSISNIFVKQNSFLDIQFQVKSLTFGLKIEILAKASVEMLEMIFSLK
jgi:hypothetical protein